MGSSALGCFIAEVEESTTDVARYKRSVIARIVFLIVPFAIFTILHIVLMLLSLCISKKNMFVQYS
jgi:hypothetical protein